MGGRMLKEAAALYVGPSQRLDDADMGAERSSLISRVIVPFAIRNVPSSELFVALKDLEMSALVRGEAVPDLAQTLSRIEAAKDGAGRLTGLPATTSPDRNDDRRHRAQQFKTILSVALNAPNLLFDLLERYRREDIPVMLDVLGKLVPVYLVVTEHGYSLGGGGESFMHETCKIMNEFGAKCIWVSFAGSDLRPYSNSATTEAPYYLDVRQAGGMTRERIFDSIRQWSPDLIHSQARANEYVAEAATALRVPALVGYHFWHGLIKLGSTSHRRILRNAHLHSIAKEQTGMQSALVTRYVASEFMADMYKTLGGSAPIEIYHPIPDPGHYETSRDGPRDHVVQINIAEGKGGAILLECIRSLGSKIPFLAVRTDPGQEHERLDRAVELAIADSPGSIYAERGAVKNHYARARMVIVPTLVDETFCRVAFEAVMNGIPLLCTGNGFLPYMLGDSGVYIPEDTASWSTAIEVLYDDQNRLAEIARTQKARVQELFGDAPEAFLKGALQSLARAPKRNVGFFTAWAEQGLGVLTRDYAKLLRRAGYRTHVFSFHPYWAADKALTFQHGAEDWKSPENADSVYYSFNDRENVTSRELQQFLTVSNVGTLIYPEICYAPNWARLKSLALENLAVCAVPNIETVRKREVAQHNALHATWFNTKQAANVLSKFRVKNGTYVGHGFGPALSADFLERKVQNLRTRDHIAFVHVGGHKPLLRKRTDLVIEAFTRALQQRDDIRLTVTVAARELGNRSLPPNITIIDRMLSHEDILDLYEQSDVSIQVSSHEGLGLGFYESISRGTPIISLDVPPHNEVVEHGRSGWLLKARSCRLPDNDDALVTAAKFDVADLTEILAKLSRDEIEGAIASTCQMFSQRFDELPFLMRLVGAMPNRTLAGPRAVREPGPAWRMGRRAARAIWKNRIPAWVEAGATLVRGIDRCLSSLGRLTNDRTPSE
jgi:glycosyltransferase involved in cell wall biosynthesis